VETIFQFFLGIRACKSPPFFSQAGAAERLASKPARSLSESVLASSFSFTATYFGIIIPRTPARTFDFLPCLCFDRRRAHLLRSGAKVERKKSLLNGISKEYKTDSLASRFNGAVWLNVPSIGIRRKTFMHQPITGGGWTKLSLL